MSSPNRYQIGGMHYKSKYEHWDWVLDCGLGYLDGTASKYISRWEKKGGVEDLKKALHYIEKLLSVLTVTRIVRRHQQQQQLSSAVMDMTKHFCSVNALGGAELGILSILATWRDEVSLRLAADLIKELIEQNEQEAVEIPPAEPVPLTEENHYAPRIGDVDD